MKKPTLIASIRCLRVQIPFDHGGPPPHFAGRPRTTLDSVWVRVELENGLVGWGESYAADLDAIVSIFRNRVVPLVIGRDASEPGLGSSPERTLHNMGRSGPVAHALSGLDIALWDLRAKLAGVPLYELLGGARRLRIPAYASLLQYAGDAELVSRNSERALADGYGQVKLHERTVEAVRAARLAIGPDIPLMLDTNCAWDLPAAIRLLHEMREFKLLWVEEPLWPPEDVSALATLREAGGTPVAVGENASSVHELQGIVRSRLADYVQPSAIKSGGVTTLAMLSDLCDESSVRHSPQSAFFGPGFLATLHVLAAQQREAHVERLFCNLEAVPYATTVPFEAGAFQLGDRPGLGAEPEPEFLSGSWVT